MTDHSPGVPSPQEELRRVVFSALHIHSWDPIEKIADKITEAIAPLFAARAAAIEAERDRYRLEAELSGREVYGMYQHWRERAEKAEARVAELTAELADGRNAKQCPRCGNWCIYDGWDHVHAYGIGIGSCEQRVAAERTQAAAQALLAGAEKWDGPDHRVWKPSQVAAELRRAARAPIPVIECSHPPRSVRVIWQAMHSGDTTSKECLACMYVWTEAYYDHQATPEEPS